MDNQHDDLTETGVFRFKRDEWAREFVERVSEPLDHDELVRRVNAS